MSHVGYCVRDALVFCLINYMNVELITEDEAFDNSLFRSPRTKGSDKPEECIYGL